MRRPLPFRVVFMDLFVGLCLRSLISVFGGFYPMPSEKAQAPHTAEDNTVGNRISRMTKKTSSMLPYLPKSWYAGSFRIYMQYYIINSTTFPF